MMRFFPVLLCGTALSPALADDKACFNPHFSYRTHATGYHELIAENTIGSHVARVRITTSCIDLHNADFISLGTAFGCLGRGDDVTAVSIDGRRQRCIVTNIEPDVPTKNTTTP